MQPVADQRPLVLPLAISPKVNIAKLDLYLTESYPEDIFRPYVRRGRHDRQPLLVKRRVEEFDGFEYFENRTKTASISKF